MAEIDRLTGCIEWIELSFVERKRTPEWAIQVGIRCHLAGVSTRAASQFLDELGVKRSHVAIHNWVHKADRQPVSTVNADQLAVDERVIRTDDNDYWLSALSILKRMTSCVVDCFRRPQNRPHGGFSPSFIDAIGSMMSNFSSMTLITR